MLLDEALDFTGRRVLITGAANGFGEATARAFAERGASLILADIEKESLLRLAAELRCEGHVFDQSVPESVERLAQVAGPIDILVNNAGVLIARPLLETTLEDIRRLVDTDLIGALVLMQSVGRGMVERKRGVIVSIGSQTAFSGGENRAVYAAAKAAISQLTRAAAVEWGPHGVRVVCLAPGRSITRMTLETARPGYTGDRGLSRVPLGRWGRVEEVAATIVFLSSDAAGYITGETVVADGGYVVG
jgi:NAD(P)-dependent dehydrogenase (short-subunit alcohol dehydrogenase family)